MTRAFSGGKRQREATRDRHKKEKEQRLARNRAMRAPGDADSEIVALEGEPQALPEVKLEDVVIGVARQPKRSTIGPVKLFVGGLSWGTTAEDLRAAFVRFGAIEDSVVISDRATGRSRGFGFVTFTGAAEAMEAIKNMDGAELDGRTLKVNRAESR